MLFDFANQPFYTLIVTFIFGPYFVAQIAPDAVRGQALWAHLQLAGALAVAVLAPILGAIADRAGRRKPWLAAFSLVFVAGAGGLWFAAPGAPFALVALCFVAAFIASELCLVFTNAMLPDLSPRAETGRLSGSGWAAGYTGGVLALVLVLALFAPMGAGGVTLAGIPPVMGLDPDLGEPARATGPLTALWYLVFAAPLFLFVPDTPRALPLARAARAGLAGLRGTVRGLGRARGLGPFLLASMIYRDALAGLFAFGGIFAAGVLGWGTMELGVFGIVAAATGAVGAWAGGRADRRFGPRPVIAGAIVVLIGVGATALATDRSAIWGVALPPGSSLPDRVFLICGGLLGAGAGALQAASRTLLVQIAAGRVPMTEAFGLYALSGKATAFLAPLMIGIATTLSGSQRVGVAPVLILFAAGLVLLHWSKPPQEARA